MVINLKQLILFSILFLTSLCSAGVDDSNLVSYYPLNEVNDSNVIFDQQSATKGYLVGTPYYLMACHKANLAGMYDSNDLYLFDSNDGKAWRLLNGGSSYHEPVYQFRDPSIFKHTNGNYYITYTNNNLGGYDGNQIGIIKSSDLVTWTHVCYVKFAGGTHVWAPEWYVDPTGIVHIFVMINFGMDEIHPTVVGDFNNWSTPAYIFNGRPAYAGCYDPYITKRLNDPNYYMFHTGAGNFIEVATCATPAGWYTPTTDVNDWAGWSAGIGGYGIEGPCVIWLGGTSWRVYFQRTIGASYWSESNDNWKTWTAPVLCTDNSTAVQIGHGTIMRYGSGRWTSQHTTAGQVGTALSFNGSTDYIDTKNTFNNDFNDSFSVSILCKPDDGQPVSDQVLCGSHTQGQESIDTQFIIRLLTSGKINVTYYSAADNGTTLDSSVVFPTDGAVGSFHHIAGVVEKISSTQIKVKIYFDGVLVGESAVVDNANMSYYNSYNTKKLYIGAYNDNGTTANYYSGVLDDIRIYNKAITQEQITAIYNDAGLPDHTAPTPNPIAWAIEPNATSSSSITMTATAETDISGVEYYFANITDPSHDSSWVATPVWTDTGLVKNTTYTYQVKARDMSTNHNETGWSDTAIATTLTWVCTSSIASDIDGDCQVNLSDFVRMADAWAGNLPPVDLNHDGKLDFKDLAQFAIDWLTCGRSPDGECWQ